VRTGIVYAASRFKRSTISGAANARSSIEGRARANRLFPCGRAIRTAMSASRSAKLTTAASPISSSVTTGAAACSAAIRGASTSETTNSVALTRTVFRSPSCFNAVAARPIAATASSAGCASAAMRRPSPVKRTPLALRSSKRMPRTASSASSRLLAVDTETPRALAAALSELRSATARSHSRSEESTVTFPQNAKLLCTVATYIECDPAQQ
jgi:hypothetical protein